MRTLDTLPKRPAAAWLAMGLLMFAAASQAASLRPPSTDPLQLRYERERADCLAGQTSEPRQVCLREAAAAYAQARRGHLDASGDGPAVWQANALRRCQAQPREDRNLCERRVREGQVSGSVAGGGQLTTLTVRSTDTVKSPGR